jgi:circadian clock protein KaiB
MHVFKLYVASSSGGRAALAGGLKRALGGVLEDGEFKIETINVLESPDQAIAGGILATPTIVRESPAPETRVTGDCSDMITVLDRLGLTAGPGLVARPKDEGN